MDWASHRFCACEVIHYNRDSLKSSVWNFNSAFIVSSILSVSIGESVLADGLKKILTNVVSPNCAVTATTHLAKFGLDKWTWKMNLQLEGERSWSGFDATSMSWATLRPSGSANAEIQIHPSSMQTEKALKIAIANTPCNVTETPNLNESLKRRTKLSKKPRIYYSWSTGMILSLEGMQNLVRLAEENSAELYFVADPKLDQTSIEKWKSKLNVNSTSIQPNWLKLEEEGLKARGLQRQYPSVLLEAHGKIQNTAYPGHKPFEVWQQWFKQSERELKNSMDSK